MKETLKYRFDKGKWCCKNCHVYNAKFNDSGECRKNAPKDDDTLFPKVMANMWCGEFSYIYFSRKWEDEVKLLEDDE